MTAITVAQNQAAGPQKSIFQKMDANGDGKVTTAEHQARATEWFKKLDVNKDGKLTPDEYRGASFVSLDLNKDGTVTMEEYYILFVGKAAAAGADKVAVSDKLDANGDNETTSTEIIAYRKSIFKAMDANKDGKLTPDEMKAYQDKRFKDLDANKDGFVTVEELVAIVPGSALKPAPKASAPKAN